MPVPFDLVLEDVLRLLVVEILLEELQQTVSCRGTILIIEHATDFRTENFARRQILVLKSFQQVAVRSQVGQGKGERGGQFPAR